MVGRPGFVFSDKTRREFGPENALPLQPVLRQKIVQQRIQPALQPPGDGNAESLLWAVYDLGRDNARDGFLKYEFGGAAAELKVRRKRSRELRHSVIKERRPDLQGNSHACAIHFRQDVLGKIELHIKVLHTLDKIFGIAVLQKRAGPAVCVGLGDAFQKAAGQHL